MAVQLPGKHRECTGKTPGLRRVWGVVAVTESDFQTEVLTALRKLDAGQVELKKELCEFRADMGQRLGRQWQTNQNIERHLRKLAGDPHLSIVAEG